MSIVWRLNHSTVDSSSNANDEDEENPRNVEHYNRLMEHIKKRKMNGNVGIYVLAILTFAYLAPSFTVKVSVVYDFDYWWVSFSNSFRFNSDFLFYYEKIRFPTKVFTYNICMYVDNIFNHSPTHSCCSSHVHDLISHVFKFLTN